MSSTVEYRLKSAKVIKRKDKPMLDVAFDEITTTEGGEVIVTPCFREGAKEVHPDLLKALSLLVPHFLILAELKTPKDFKRSYLENDEALNDASISSFEVTAVHFKEKNEVRHLILSGRKTLTSGRVINNIQIPMQSLADTEENSYIYTDLLDKAASGAMSRFEDYLAGTYAPNPQTTLTKVLDESMEVKDTTKTGKPKKQAVA